MYKTPQTTWQIEKQFINFLMWESCKKLTEKKNAKLNHFYLQEAVKPDCEDIQKMYLRDVQMYYH